MLIDFDVAPRLEAEVEQPVHRQQLEHVVEERKAALNARFARAVEREADLDVRLLRPPDPARRAQGGHRPRSARTSRRASKSRSFSVRLPIVARSDSPASGHDDTSRTRTPRSRSAACNAAAAIARCRKRTKFAADENASIAERPRSSRSRRDRSSTTALTRSASPASSATMRVATSCVSVPTLYGSRAASYVAAIRRSATSAPSRRPAAACAFEKVRATTTFGCSAIRGRKVWPENSAYASSTRTSVRGASAAARIVASSTRSPVGLFGDEKQTTSGRTRATASRTRAASSAYGTPTRSSQTRMPVRRPSRAYIV